MSVEALLAFCAASDDRTLVAWCIQCTMQAAEIRLPKLLVYSVTETCTAHRAGIEHHCTSFLSLQRSISLSVKLHWA